MKTVSFGCNEESVYLFAEIVNKLINASENNPVQNLCFEIKNWKSRTAKSKIKINGVSQVQGENFRQGVNIDTDGTYTLIVWLRLSAKTLQHFNISEE